MAFVLQFARAHFITLQLGPNHIFQYYQIHPKIHLPTSLHFSPPLTNYPTTGPSILASHVHPHTSLSSPSLLPLASHNHPKAHRPTTQHSQSIHSCISSTSKQPLPPSPPQHSPFITLLINSLLHLWVLFQPLQHRRLRLL